MYFYITIILSVIIDLVTKSFAIDYFQEKINIFSNFIFIKYYENTWIAFSVNIPFLKVLTIILIISIFYYYFKEEKKKKDKIIDLSFWLILWWAIWNWFERVFNWKVIDFIWVQGFSIFNMADTFISIWAIFLLINLLKNNK